jgi:cell pole-organizing protein PopZ
VVGADVTPSVQSDIVYTPPPESNESERVHVVPVAVVPVAPVAAATPMIAVASSPVVAEKVLAAEPIVAKAASSSQPAVVGGPVESGKPQAAIQPVFDAPVLRVAMPAIAPVRPKLPETPMFIAPAPTAMPVQPSNPAPVAVVAGAAPAEPQVDALAMLSAAVTAASASSSVVPKPGVEPPAQPVAVVANAVPQVEVQQSSMAELEDAPERTLEDTVAELLRPMLRQWLSDNMPRIVEKALRIELAQSLRPGPKPRG